MSRGAKGNPYEYQILAKLPPFSHKRYFKQRIQQLIFRYSTNSPFLSGDTFAELVDYSPFGKRGDKSLNRNRLRKAKSLFVVGHKVSELIESEFNNINANLLISGNSDQNFTESLKLPKSIRHWYCQNNAIPNSKIVKTLPIGIENIRLANLGFPSNYNQVTIEKRIDKVIVPPMSATNIARFSAVEWGEKSSEIAEVVRKMVPRKDYFPFINQYKFIVCCEGNGFDSHRVWESLYLGSFPILIRTPWSTNLEYLNLPILIVDEYSDINLNLLNEFLKKWRNFEPKKTEILWIPYWKNLFGKLI